MSDGDFNNVDLLPLARRIELANGAGMAECAQHWAEEVGSDAVARQIAGAWAIAGDGQSPLARVVGLGLGQMPTDDELDAIESLYVERDQPPRIDLTCYAEQDLWQRLADRGYRATGVNAVFVRSLKDPVDHETPTAAVRIEIARLQANDQHAVDEGVDVMARAFEDPPPDWLTRVTRQAVIQPSSHTFLARLNGHVVGGGFLVVGDGLAQLFGGGVLDTKRRCGVQSALIRQRLFWGRDSGADMACIMGRPGGPTDRNARRAGFVLGYTKTVLTKESA